LLIVLGWVGLGKSTDGLGWIRSHKMDPWTTLNYTEMWADAQRDGRPAEYRWRPLFNAAKFG